MSRSYKQEASSPYLPSKIRESQNRKRKLRQRDRLNKGCEVIEDKQFNKYIDNTFVKM